MVKQIVLPNFKLLHVVHREKAMTSDIILCVTLSCSLADSYPEDVGRRFLWYIGNPTKLHNVITQKTEFLIFIVKTLSVTEVGIWHVCRNSSNIVFLNTILSLYSICVPHKLNNGCNMRVIKLVALRWAGHLGRMDGDEPMKILILH
jgi:hypothetical protein